MSMSRRNFVKSLGVAAVASSLITTGAVTAMAQGTSKKTSPVFEPVKIGNLELKNRMIKSASQELRSDELGSPTADLIRVYTDMAKGGIAMIITGLTYVLRDEQYNKNGAGMYDDSQIEAYKALTDAVHNNGAKICAQLALIGSNRNYNLDKRVFAPSALIGSSYGTKVKEDMTQDEIKLAVDAVAAAAVRAQKAGFDAIELHLAHEYLACQFLMPYFNKRTDEYGGDKIENRARFAFEIVEAVRKAIGKDFPLIAKFASTHERGEQGNLRKDIDYLAQGLKDRGLDALDISGGNEVEDFNPSHRNILFKEDQCYFAHDARQMTATVKIPLILTGGNRDLGMMETAMEHNSNIMAFGMARALIRQPDLPNRWMADVSYTPTCISCNWCRDNYGGQKTRCRFRPDEA